MSFRYPRTAPGRSDPTCHSTLVSCPQRLGWPKRRDLLCVHCTKSFCTLFGNGARASVQEVDKPPHLPCSQKSCSSHLSLNPRLLIGLAVSRSKFGRLKTKGCNHPCPCGGAPKKLCRRQVLLRLHFSDLEAIQSRSVKPRGSFEIRHR